MRAIERGTYCGLVAGIAEAAIDIVKAARGTIGDERAVLQHDDVVAEWPMRVDEGA